MSNIKSISLVEELVVPIIENLGLTFVDVDFKKINGNHTLTVYIDNENGGVTINDCETVSKAIDLPLDELDFTNGISYNLNVSSPGLDRALKRDVDFKRNLNKEIQVKFYKPLIDGKKIVEGVLLNYSDKNFVINLNGIETTINKEDVALATPVIKW